MIMEFLSIFTYIFHSDSLSSSTNGTLLFPRTFTSLFDCSCSAPRLWISNPVSVRNPTTPVLKIVLEMYFVDLIGIYHFSI